MRDYHGYWYWYLLVWISNKRSIVYLCQEMQSILILISLTTAINRVIDHALFIAASDDSISTNATVIGQ